jgi:hypothetical protein
VNAVDERKATARTGLAADNMVLPTTLPKVLRKGEVRGRRGGRRRLPCLCAPCMPVAWRLAVCAWCSCVYVCARVCVFAGCGR